MTRERFEGTSDERPVVASNLLKRVPHAALAIIALLVLFCISQVNHLVGIAAAIHPALGHVVAAGLVGSAGWLVGVPLVGYLRLDRALVPPLETAGPRRAAFVEDYLRILRGNPRLPGQRLETPEDLEVALKHLELEAEAVAKRTASRVFLATAISQNGSLDALIVAVTQLRMVWDIGHVFHQRPSLRQLRYLYANVLLTAFVATQVSRVDLTDYLRPVLVNTLGKAMVVVPGAAAASGLVSSGLLRGSFNAFLTLRVAMVAIAYCRATVRPDRTAVGRGAVIRAGELVVRTVAHGSADVAKAFAECIVTAIGKGIAKAGKLAVDVRFGAVASTGGLAKKLRRATVELRDSALSAARSITDVPRRRTNLGRRARADNQPGPVNRVSTPLRPVRLERLLGIARRTQVRAQAHTLE